MSITEWLLSIIDIMNFLHREKVTEDIKWIEEGEESKKRIWEKLLHDSKMLPAMSTSLNSLKPQFSYLLNVDKDSTYIRVVVRIEWHNICKAFNIMPRIMHSQCSINADIMINTISLLLLLPSFILYSTNVCWIPIICQALCWVLGIWICISQTLLYALRLYSVVKKT